MSNTLVTIKHDLKQVANDTIFSAAVLYGIYTADLDTKLAQVSGLNPYTSTVNQAILSGVIFGGVNWAQREAVRMKLPVNIL